MRGKKKKKKKKPCKDFCGHNWHDEVHSKRIHVTFKKPWSWDTMERKWDVVFLMNITN